MYWLKKGYLKKETESTIIAVQDQALCARNMRNVVYGENVQFICRVRDVVDKRCIYCLRMFKKSTEEV